MFGSSFSSEHQRVATNCHNFRILFCSKYYFVYYRSQVSFTFLFIIMKLQYKCLLSRHLILLAFLLFFFFPILQILYNFVCKSNRLLKSEVQIMFVPLLFLDYLLWNLNRELYMFDTTHWIVSLGILMQSSHLNWVRKRP